jgi:hypothetical protein
MSSLVDAKMDVVEYVKKCILKKDKIDYVI